MSDERRIETMATKLAAYAQRANVPHHDLIRAYEVAVEQRIAYLRDVFHPDLLHPARTALILLEDAGVRAEDVLAAGAVTETEFADLRVPATALRASFNARITELQRMVPVPSEVGGLLLERLLELPDSVAMIALAERLDHARHLHFRDSVRWPAFHAEVNAVYLPFAHRISDPLALRFERWAHAFERRFLLST